MNLGADLKFSLRKLRKTPFHTLTTFVVLVLGLSLYISSYSFTRMQTNKPMPFPNGDHYMAIKALSPQQGLDQWEDAFDFRTYFRLREISDNYSTLGAIQLKPATLSNDDNYAKRYDAATVSVDFFTTTSVNPILGRSFSAEDASAAAPDVAIISYTLWKDYFNSQADIIGQTARIDNKTYTVIGVMPEGFHFPSYEYLWFPLRPDTIPQTGLTQPVTLAAIIKPNVSRQTAALELDNLLAQLVDEYPDDYSLRAALIVPYAQAEEPSTFSLSFSILITAYVLLALTVVNLSSLLYMRASSRQQELAVRASLGANGMELAKQVLIESFIICFTGLLISLLLSSVMLKVVGQVYWDEVFWYTFDLDGQTLWVAFICTLFIWLLSGLTVAFRAWSTRPGKLLNQSNRGAGDKQTAKASNFIVFIEVILSCFLLVTTGSVIFETKMTLITDFGIDSKYTGVARFDIAPLINNGPHNALNFVDDLVQEVKNLPDVEDAGVASRFPGWNGIEGTYQTQETIGLMDEDNFPRQSSIWISNNYFNAIGIDLIEGRYFNDGDTEDSPAVTIITNEFATKLWPNQSPIGKQIVSTIDNKEQVLTVVGTIQPLVQASNDMSIFLIPTLYRPLAQSTPSFLYLVFNHRPGASLSNLEQSIRLAVARVDRNVALERFGKLDIVVHENEGPTIFLITETFALSTLVLAAIGVFAVLSRSILQRTRDIGICRALGADNRRIFIKYGKQGIYFLIAGLLFGSLPAIIALTYLLAPGMGSNNVSEIPIIGIAITMVMFLVIAAACFVPAKIALRLQPGDALRYE